MFPKNDQIASMFKSFQPSNEQFTNVLRNMFPAVSQSPFLGNEQFANAVKTSAETQVAFYNQLTASILATIEKLIELNMSTAKVSLDESTVIVNQLFNSRDAQEIQALLSALPQSVLAKTAAYSSHLANIGSASQTELTRAAAQQLENMGVKLSSLIDQASKDMPAGSEHSAAAAKAILASASAGYQQFSKNAQQAGEAVASQASDTAEKVSQLAAQAPVAVARMK